MFTVRLKGSFLLFSVIQFVMISVIFWLLYFLYNTFRFQGSHPIDYYIYAWFVILASYGVEILSRTNLNYALSKLSKDRLYAICHRQALFALAFLLGFLVMSKSDSISRLFLLTFFGSFMCWSLWTNVKGYKLLENFLFGNHQKGLFPTLLVGTKDALNRYIDHPDRPAPPGTRIEGFVPVGEDEIPDNLQIEISGDFTDLEKICSERKIKAVMCLGIGDRHDLVPTLSRVTTNLGIRSIWLDDVEHRYGKGSMASNASTYSIVAQSREPLEDPFNRAIKRVFDIILSLIGIIFILPPAIAFVAYLHRRHSKGPLFYRQERSGRHGEIFNVTKFRSMFVSTDDKFIQATDGDSRIFKGGDLIRKYSIDELPQLLNVLTGQMSIVGPRPHPLKLDENLAPDTQAYRVRHQAKPGITGLAQSRGWRGETIEPRQIENRVKMDLFYIRNWSILFDIRIIVETAWQIVVPPKSAR